MKKLLFTICFLSIYTLNAQDYKVVFWEDLKPKSDFKDPFKAMDLFQLKNSARLFGLMAKAEKENTSLSEEEIAEKKDLESKLKADNIDFESLYANRIEIVKKRKEAIEGLNKSLNNTKIEISGYLLPLNFTQGKSNEFLLVPWVGACIHTPPPPKNQIIYVKTEDLLTAPSLFDAVILKGEVTLTENVSNLFLDDGSALIPTGYSVIDAKIEKL